MSTTTTTTTTTTTKEFDALMTAINNGNMTMEKKHDVLMALANFIVSR
jgi:hypothetical protein